MPLPDRTKRPFFYGGSKVAIFSAFDSAMYPVCALPIVPSSELVHVHLCMHIKCIISVWRIIYAPVVGDRWSGRVFLLPILLPPCTVLTWRTLAARSLTSRASVTMVKKLNMSNVTPPPVARRFRLHDARTRVWLGGVCVCVCYCVVL